MHNTDDIGTRLVQLKVIQDIAHLEIILPRRVCVLLGFLVPWPVSTRASVETFNQGLVEGQTRSQIHKWQIR